MVHKLREAVVCAAWGCKPAELRQMDAGDVEDASLIYAHLYGFLLSSAAKSFFGGVGGSGSPPRRPR